MLSSSTSSKPANSFRTDRDFLCLLQHRPSISSSHIPPVSNSAYELSLYTVWSNRYHCYMPHFQTIPTTKLTGHNPNNSINQSIKQAITACINTNTNSLFGMTAIKAGLKHVYNNITNIKQVSISCRRGIGWDGLDMYNGNRQCLDKKVDGVSQMVDGVPQIEWPQL